MGSILPGGLPSLVLTALPVVVSPANLPLGEPIGHGVVAQPEF